MANHLRLVDDGEGSPARRLVRHALWPLLAVALPLSLDPRPLGPGSADDEKREWECGTCHRSLKMPPPAPYCPTCDVRMAPKK